MPQDIIYIDVEDDITSIIGKVKKAKQKNVSLVPPKRIGVLQSAVNLRLLARTAKQSDKTLAIVTNNDALQTLAASASIPTAKSIHDDATLAAVAKEPVEDTTDDVIDGSQLPIGDLARATAAARTEGKLDQAVTDIEQENATKPVKKPKKSKKVPNFNKFRKRLVLIILAILLLAGFLVWAIFFAPKATITITAKTQAEQYDSPVSLGKETDPATATIASISQDYDDTEKVEFSATGKKEVGHKATGTVTFKTDSWSLIKSDTTIPSGSRLTSSSGKTYTTDSAVTLSKDNDGAGSTGITATERGESYNGAEGNLDGAPDKVSARLSDATSGGTDKTITIVSKADVERAKKDIQKADTAKIKDALSNKFSNGVVVIDDSLKAHNQKTSSSPAVGEEASDGSATLTRHATYTMYGVDKNEIDTYLKAAFEGALDDTDKQKVYETGAKAAKFADFEAGKTPKVSLSATGQIGPKVSTTAVKRESRGKNYGEIESAFNGTDGIKNVDVSFFPFWVHTVPNDVDKITVTFKLHND